MFMDYFLSIVEKLKTCCPDFQDDIFPVFFVGGWGDSKEWLGMVSALVGHTSGDLSFTLMDVLAEVMQNIELHI